MRKTRLAVSAIGDHVLRKLGVFVHLDDRHVAALDRLLSDCVPIDGLHDIVTEGESCRNLFLLTQGWAVRYKLLPDGRRQILGFVIPGDFFGLRATLFDVADDTVQSLMACNICRIPTEDFVAVLQEYPQLGMAIVWSIVREYSVLAEHLVSVGRRSAYERTAHLLMELLNRLQLVNLAGVRDFQLPLTQELLADALGLSIVHVNRTLRRLREQGLIRLDPQSRWITIDNPDNLAEAAGFNPDYLDQGNLPADSLINAIKSRR